MLILQVGCDYVRLLQWIAKVLFLNLRGLSPPTSLHPYHYAGESYKFNVAKVSYQVGEVLDIGMVRQHKIHNFFPVLY